MIIVTISQSFGEYSMTQCISNVPNYNQNLLGSHEILTIITIGVITIILLPENVLRETPTSRNPFGRKETV